jgi:predicted DsbA family dithiol-disulfide isomerase
MKGGSTMRKKALVVVLAGCALCLAACKGGGGGAGHTRSSGGPYNCFTDAPADAKVTLEVFTSPTRAETDENPAEKVKDAAKDFDGKVKCVLRPVSPFEQANALAAGKAILAAGEQGKAWDMYDYLKAHMKEMSDTMFTDAAKALELDLDKFNHDFASDEIAEQVKLNTQKTSQGHPLRRVQLDGQWAPCGTQTLDCLADKIKEKLQTAG